MADQMYHEFYHQLFLAAHDLTTTTGSQLKVALMDTNHSASTVDDAIWTDVSTNELPTAGNYTQPGLNVTKGNMVPSDDDSNNRGVFDITMDMVWSTATFSAYYAVLYNDDHASDGLICSYDFGGVKTASGGDFTLQFSSAPAAAFYIA